MRQTLYKQTLSGQEAMVKDTLKDQLKAFVASYKDLAKKYHPDRVTEAQQKVLNTEAFKKLRQVYDQIEKGWELALQGIDAANYFVAEQGEDKEQTELLKEQNKLLKAHTSLLKKYKEILQDMHKEINDFFSSEDFENQVEAQIKAVISARIKAQISLPISAQIPSFTPGIFASHKDDDKTKENNPDQFQSPIFSNIKDSNNTHDSNLQSQQQLSTEVILKPEI